MKKSTKKISWMAMVNKFDSLGYDYTGDALYLPKGYKRKQNIFRFDFSYKKGCKKLKASEIRDLFNNEITVYTGASLYAPELSCIYATNRLYI